MAESCRREYSCSFYQLAVKKTILAVWKRAFTSKSRHKSTHMLTQLQT